MATVGSCAFSERPFARSASASPPLTRSVRWTARWPGAHGLRGTGVAALGALLIGLSMGCGDGSEEAPGGLRRYRNDSVSFVYPETWEVTHDTFDLDTPNARVIVLRVADDAVVLLHSFTPSSGWRLGEFVQEFGRQRRRELDASGSSRPRDLEQSSIEWSTRGRRLPGLRQDFALEREGVLSRQTSLFFELPREDGQVFVSVHLPTPMLEPLKLDLRALLSSLRGGSLS